MSATLTRTRGGLRLPSSLLAAAGLAVGFGVAQGTGSRPIGGVVLVVCGVGAGLLWLRRRGWAATAGLAALYLVAFAMAHVLALGAGWPAWAAVALVTAVDAVVTFWVADRTPRRA